MRLALAIASFVILIVHGVVFYNQFGRPWERHQTAYFEQARSLTTRPEERAELGRRGAEGVRAHYGVAHMAERALDAYGKIVAAVAHA